MYDTKFDSRAYRVEGCELPNPFTIQSGDAEYGSIDHSHAIELRTFADDRISAEAIVRDA